MQEHRTITKELTHWTYDTVQSWLHKPRELAPTFYDANLGSGDGKEAWNTHDESKNALEATGFTEKKLERKIGLVACYSLNMTKLEYRASIREILDKQRVTRMH